MSKSQRVVVLVPAMFAALLSLASACGSAGGGGPTEGPAQGTSDEVGDDVGAVARTLSQATVIGAQQVRELIAAATGDRSVTPDETRFFERLSRGAPTSVKVGPDRLVLPAADARGCEIAALVAAPPNMNTLWGEDPGRMATLVEMSRWGDAARQRVALFVYRQLLPAAEQSTLLNSYAPFVGLYGRAWEVFRAMGDAEARELARVLLLDAGAAAVAEREKQLGQEPRTLLFLVIWLDTDSARKDAQTGKPLVPRPSP